VVREIGGMDAIQIRPMCYVSLTIDHRVVDGPPDQWLAQRFVEILENWPIEAPDAQPAPSRRSACCHGQRPSISTSIEKLRRFG
jgi:hypothetical protein